MSAAVVVVEAGITGGALITAAKSAEYGIPVFDPGDLVEELGLIHDLAETRGEAQHADQSSTSCR